MYTALACEAEAQMQHEKADHLRSMVEPIWSGQLAYRGLVSAKEAVQNGFKDVDTPLIVSSSAMNRQSLRGTTPFFLCYGILRPSLTFPY